MCACFWALQTYWQTIQTSNCDIQVKILLKFALISRVSKIFKTLMRLMLEIEAQNLTKLCNQECLMENKFQIYATMIMVVTIAIRLA